MRIFLLAFTVLITVLTLSGLAWQLSLLYVSAMLIIFTVFGRIIAETGMFHLSPNIYPCVLIIGFFDEQALGIHILAFLFFLTSIFLLDPRECFMPFIVNSLEISRGAGVKARKLLPVVAIVMILGLGISVPVTLYFCYSHGVNWQDGFGSSMVPHMAIDGTLASRVRMIAQDTLERAESVKGFQRFPLIKPDRNFAWAFFAVFAAVLLFTAARLRWAWWPLHPVLFCLWPRYAGYMFATSFLLGSLIKMLAAHYGGSRLVNRLKPMMYGLIASDMISGLITILCGILYYLNTDKIPKSFWILPGSRLSPLRFLH
jgi:hypothetical protein